PALSSTATCLRSTANATRGTGAPMTGAQSRGSAAKIVFNVGPGLFASGEYGAAGAGGGGCPGGGGAVAVSAAGRDAGWAVGGGAAGAAHHGSGGAGGGGG